MSKGDKYTDSIITNYWYLALVYSKYILRKTTR